MKKLLNLNRRWAERRALKKLGVISPVALMLTADDLEIKNYNYFVKDHMMEHRVALGSLIIVGSIFALLPTEGRIAMGVFLLILLFVIWKT